MARVPDEFERAMLEVMPHLQAFTRYLAKDADKASDLAQDTIERAWKARDSFVLGTNMKMWLYVICRNVFYSQKRRAWRWVQMPVMVGRDGSETDMADTIPVAPAAMDKLELDDLLEAIGYLPAEQANAILLIMEGVSYEDAAGELGVDPGTVKSRVSRGRVALQAYFANTYRRGAA